MRIAVAGRGLIGSKVTPSPDLLSDLVDVAKAGCGWWAGCFGELGAARAEMILGRWLSCGAAAG